MSGAIYRDELWDGASDPTVIRREGTAEWWMFYTQRRALHEGPGVEWVHGSRIAVAVSTDGGATWLYRGVVAGLDEPAGGPGSGPDSGPNTHWAPEVVRIGGSYHMYLTWIAGTPDAWAGHDRQIVHVVSDDLAAWTRLGRLELGGDSIIDAAVARTPDDRLRMWFKDEGRGSTTWSAVSADGHDWEPEGVVVDGPPHEGPNVFELGGWWWLIVDEWRGQAVYRSSDGVDWHRQHDLILAVPGARPDDRQVGRHADVVTLDESRAVIFYFTHPGWDGSELALAEGVESRRSAIHVALLTVDAAGLLRADRDALVAGEPFLPLA